MKKKPKKHAVPVRMNTPEYFGIRGRAREAGVSMSRYLIEAGLSEGVVIDREGRLQVERVLFEVRRIGTNLNQLARSLNGGAVEREGLARCLREVEVVLGELRKTTGEESRGNGD